MEKVFNGTSKRNIGILATFAVFCIAALFANTPLPSQYEFIKNCIDIIKLIVFVIFSIDILLDLKSKKIDKKTFLILAPLGLLSVITLLASRKPHMLILTLFVAEFRKFKFEDVVKFALAAFQTTFIVVITLSIFKVLPNLYIERSAEQMRYALGFGYVTIASTCFLFIILMSAYLKKSNMPWVEVLYSFLISILLYYITDSRCDFFISIGVILSIALIKLIKNFNFDKFFQNKYIKLLIVALPMFFLLMSVIIYLLYLNKVDFVIKLDRILSGRLFYTAKAIEKYGYSIFGVDVSFGAINAVDNAIIQPDNYHFVDNGYFHILLNYGLVNLLLVIVGYTLMLHKSIKKQNYWLVFCLIVSLINGLIEPYLIEYDFNVFVISLCGIFNEESNQIKYLDKEASRKGELLNE